MIKNVISLSNTDRFKTRKPLFDVFYDICMNKTLETKELDY